MLAGISAVNTSGASLMSFVDALPLGNGLLPRLFGAYRDRMVDSGSSSLTTLRYCA